MSQLEERVAILEAKLTRNELDITQLFQFIRDHMEREEADREKTIQLLSSMNNKINEQNNKIDKQKSFWGGMLFAFSGVGALAATSVQWLSRLNGH